ncbi:hypothetical protein FRB90_003342 [Tulasnella sp. 427]|nr:hypothetical protein FRB90_003342 [Tulasnella sp. 427]
MMAPATASLSVQEGSTKSGSKPKNPKQDSRRSFLIRSATSLKTYIEKPAIQKVLEAADDTFYAILVLVLDLFVDADRDIDKSSQEALQTRFHPATETSKQARQVIQFANKVLDELEGVYKEWCQYADAIPPPSSYAMTEVWEEWQQKETAILCFRPNEKQGLPLCVLDEVFPRFQRQVKAPLPPTAEASLAMKVAFELCREMPACFAEEKDRQEKFDACVQPFLSGKWRGCVSISPKSELRSGLVDRAYEVDGVISIFREVKRDIGAGDDAYMQVSRSYQLYVASVQDKDSSYAKGGIPMFLLCVVGPLLIISGGFYDGKSTIVEPLVEPCLMFDDRLLAHQETLTCQLLALKQAVTTLCSRSPVDSSPYAPGVPRVYPTYTAEDGTQQSLTFVHPLKENLPRSLLFVAVETLSNTPTERVAKVVIGRYGTEVHQELAEHAFAPILFGQKSQDTTPTVYIMEFLSPPTTERPGWVTLFDFFQSKPASVSDHLQAFKTAIDRILNVMKDRNMVHGDLRSNNIMVEVTEKLDPILSGDDQRVNLKVIDFDWAGYSGQVHYPLHRNENIVWSGEAGAPILVEHDQEMIYRWLKAPDKD